MQEQNLLFIESLIKDGLIIAAGVFVLGQIINKSMTFIDNKYISMIGGIIGAVLGVVIPHIFPDDTIIVCAIKGLVVGWASTGASETFKNLKPAYPKKIDREE